MDFSTLRKVIKFMDLIQELNSKGMYTVVCKPFALVGTFRYCCKIKGFLCVHMYLRLSVAKSAHLISGIFVFEEPVYN